MESDFRDLFFFYRKTGLYTFKNCADNVGTQLRKLSFYELLEVQRRIIIYQHPASVMSLIYIKKIVKQYTIKKRYISIKCFQQLKQNNNLHFEITVEK